MEYNLSNKDRNLYINLQGQFTFSDNGKFRSIIQEIESDQLKAVYLNFAAVDFIDSAGLGMLLLLRDECQERNIDVLLASASGQVEKIFLISKFDQLFTLVS